MSTTRADRTAIRRTSLSRPVALALDDGLVHQERTFFDYGCGSRRRSAAAAQDGNSRIRLGSGVLSRRRAHARRHRESRLRRQRHRRSGRTRRRPRCGVGARPQGPHRLRTPRLGGGRCRRRFPGRRDRDRQAHLPEVLHAGGAPPVDRTGARPTAGRGGSRRLLRVPRRVRRPVVRREPGLQATADPRHREVPGARRRPQGADRAAHGVRDRARAPPR